MAAIIATILILAVVAIVWITLKVKEKHDA